ncbi:MAG: hypothetical protein PHD81_03495 [Candidatus Nanoarchaeia archaeon]|nr:hypothetical protein [Candidatus Nanoarchaeia archaeon]MDD5588149.1 hypothetical protein [Candidatus Nanoarchaeia archaeon]
MGTIKQEIEEKEKSKMSDKDPFWFRLKVFYIPATSLAILFTASLVIKNQCYYIPLYERAIIKADLNKDGVLQLEEKAKMYRDMGINYTIDESENREGLEPHPTIKQLEEYLK